MLIFSLTACSTGFDRPDKRNKNYQEFLETKILADGSKVFNFSLAMQNKKPSNQNEQVAKNDQKKKDKPRGRGDKPAENKDGKQAKNNKPSSTKNKKSERKQALEEYFQQRVANLKILKMFCRQGYLVLEEYIDVNEISLKAECKESASIDDYSKFTKAK